MISVILPVYRVEKYIKACIASVLGQEYKNFEVILVDDGSPDQSAQIAEELLAQDGTVPYRIIHTENRGVSAARNTGLANASGEYVIMVDSDDVIAPSFLQTYADMVLKENDCNIYSTGFAVVGEDNWQEFAPKSDTVTSLGWDEAQLAFLERRIRYLLPSLMFSREFLQTNQIRFDEDVRYSEDVQFIWRSLAYNRKSVLHNNSALYNYILHPGSTMTASSIPKILTCCVGIERLYSQIGDLFSNPVGERLVATTYFSMLHGAAKMMGLSSFRRLFKESGSETYIREMTHKGTAKIRMVAIMLLYFRPFGYWIMRKF